MIKYFKAFFYPPVLTHHYKHPKELVIAKITEVFKTRVTFFSSDDMYGAFVNTDTFAINVYSVAYTKGVRYGSTLIGQITELKNGNTEIKTTAKPSAAYYFIFFVCAVLGLGFLYKFAQDGSINSLLSSLVMLTAGPFLSIGL